VYVTTAIEQLTGRKGLVQRRQLQLKIPFQKKVQLTQFLKGHHVADEVEILTAQESFRLSSFSLSNCLIVLPEHQLEFAKGQLVETLILPYL
jgi:molybdopterin molybdotransferase